MKPGLSDFRPTAKQNADSTAAALAERRREFAKAALEGMLAHSRGDPPHGYRVPISLARQGLTWHQAIAQEAFQIADAMMRAEGGYR